MSIQRTFVVVHSGREGSSALVDHIGRHTSVCVPVFEHLDLANLATVVDDAERSIGAILDRALTKGEFPGSLRPTPVSRFSGSNGDRSAVGSPQRRCVAIDATSFISSAVDR